jgi:hypothetical protein
VIRRRHQLRPQKEHSRNKRRKHACQDRLRTNEESTLAKTGSGQTKNGTVVRTDVAPSCMASSSRSFSRSALMACTSLRAPRPRKRACLLFAGASIYAKNRRDSVRSRYEETVATHLGLLAPAASSAAFWPAIWSRVCLPCAQFAKTIEPI